MKNILTYTVLPLLAMLVFSGRSSASSRPDSLVVSGQVSEERVTEYTKEYLDTVNLKRKIVMNNYSTIGFQYGVSVNQMMFTPSKDQTTFLAPVNFGITFTHYEKMFGYMPYFGFQVGLFYGQDGYKTKEDKETGIRDDVDGAYEAVYEYIEVPMLAIFHVDIVNFRIMANLGIYGAYRLGVEREGDPDTFDTEYADKFYDYDKRLDYGIKGGMGFALVFDPIEFHVTVQARYGFSSIYEPDYYSEYYYRYAHPFDIVISAGVHFQLTKRYGRTKSSLKREAKQLVLEPAND